MTIICPNCQNVMDYRGDLNGQESYACLNKDCFVEQIDIWEKDLRDSQGVNGVVKKEE